MYVIIDLDGLYVDIYKSEAKFEEALRKLAEEMYVDGEDPKEELNDSNKFVFLAGDNIRTRKVNVKHEIRVSVKGEVLDQETVSVEAATYG